MDGSSVSEKCTVVTGSGLTTHIVSIVLCGGVLAQVEVGEERVPLCTVFRARRNAMPSSRQSRPHCGSKAQWHTRSGSRVAGAGRDFIGVARSGARSVQRAGPFARPRQASLHASLRTHLPSPRSAAIQEPQREIPRPDVVVACSPP
jgi:hypothetical protein